MKGRRRLPSFPSWLGRQRRRQRGFLLLLVLLLLLTLLGWVSGLWGSAGEHQAVRLLPRSAPSLAAAASEPAASAPRLPAQAMASAPQRSTLMPGQDRAAGTVPGLEPRDEHLYEQAGPGRQAVCGLGYADARWLNADVPKPWDQSRQDEVKQLRDQLLLLLRRSAEPADPVAAALLERPLWDVGLSADASSNLAASLVLNSRSAAAYGMAFRACVSWPGAQCAKLSAKRWTELDEQSLNAWLYLLGEAFRSNDQALMLEALYRLSLPQLHGDSGTPLYGRAQPWLAAARSQALASRLLRNEELALVAEASLQLHIIGLDFAMLGNWMGALNRVCSSQALADSNRQQLCQAVARNLLDKGRSLMDMAQGLALAERAGLAAQAMPLQRADYLALQALIGADSETQAELGESCEGYRRLTQRLVGIGRQGEWAYWRAELARQRGMPGALASP